MAVALYGNGIIEEFIPKEETFTDKEILDIFKEYKKIRTKRLSEVENTWCIWGEKNNVSVEEDFSKIASDIVEEEIFSIIIFIHDSEVNPAWTLRENIIQKDYENFKVDLLSFIDHLAEQTIKETQELRKQMGEQNNLVFLDAIGPTEDKKILFKFNPHTQSEEFYHDNNFTHFADKISEFIISKYEDNDTFFVFEDNKIKMFVEDEHVKFIIDKIINNLQTREMYEECKDIKDNYLKWEEYKNKKKNKKTRKKDNKK